jgi:hypothetical protein
MKTESKKQLTAPEILGKLDRFKCKTIEQARAGDQYTQHTTIGFDAIDRPKVSDFRVSRPHWKAYGEGTQMTEITVEHDGALTIICNEQADGARNGKEAWGSLTPAGARALMQLIDEALNKKD